MRKSRYFATLLFFLTGCAQVNQIAGIGTVHETRSDSQGRHVLETAPRYLVGTGGRSATFGGNAIGGRWESDKPDEVSITLLYQSSASGGKAKIRFNQFSVNLNGSITDFAITRPTVQRRGDFDYVSRAYFTENTSHFQMPLSYLRQMLDAQSCIVTVVTSRGTSEGDFTIAARTGSPTAKASLSKLYERIPVTGKADRAENTDKADNAGQSERYVP